MQWTPAALQALENYLDTVRDASAAAGADPAEVVEDIRTHLEEALHRRGHDVVTAEDIRLLSTRLGIPDHSGGTLFSDARRFFNPALRWWKSHWALVCGVGLPLGAWLAAVSRPTAESFSLWFPTRAHIVLALLVPTAVFAGWWTERKRERKPPLWLQWLSGAAACVAAVYTWAVGLSPLTLNPALPLVGEARLLLFAPFLSFLATVGLWKSIKSRGGTHLWMGAVAVALLFSSFEGPAAWTRMGLSRAVGDTPSLQARGLAWLRRYAHEETLRAACYGRTIGSPLDIWARLAGGIPADPQAVRRVYYQVFGAPFNARPAPSGIPDWVGREEQGGTTVGGRLAGLSLRSSHFDVKPSLDDITAYTEWTVEFENSRNVPQEARALVALPPGGVVSRLTLWVNGQEREAVFHETGRVRRAYQQIVNQRRDPVLVTSAGVDRVMVQCFPVPANGGRIRARLGITAPIRSPHPSTARLYGPVIIERNFDIADNFRHTVWNALPGSAHTTLSDRDLSSGKPWAVYPRNPRVETVWTVDPVQSGRYIVQTHFWSDLPNRDCVVVLDSSAGLDGERESLRTLFESLPDDTTVILAQDGRAIARTAREMRKKINRQRFVGGQDNLPALMAAFELKIGATPRHVVWIHGPQSIELTSADPLRRLLERDNDGRTLHTYQVSPGPHRLLEALDGLGNVVTLRAEHTLALDIASHVKDTPADWRVERSTTGQRPDGAPGKDDIARLWARDTVFSALRWTPDSVSASPAEGRPDPLHTAVAYRIVTPVSGAVVLENDWQYVQTGLRNGSAVQSQWESGIGTEGFSIRNREAGIPLADGVIKGRSPSLVVPDLTRPMASSLRTEGRNKLVVPGHFSGEMARIGAPAPYRESRRLWSKPVPTWVALFPLLLVMLFQDRRISRARSWQWAAGTVCLYGITHVFLPGYAVTALGLVAAALFVHFRQPGQPRTAVTLALLVLSLPVSPALLNGFVEKFVVPFGVNPVATAWSNPNPHSAFVNWAYALAVLILTALFPRGGRWFVAALIIPLVVVRLIPWRFW